MDRAADSGPNDLSSTPLVEKKENKQKRGWGWPIFKKVSSKYQFEPKFGRFS